MFRVLRSLFVINNYSTCTSVIGHGLPPTPSAINCASSLLSRAACSGGVVDDREESGAYTSPYCLLFFIIGGFLIIVGSDCKFLQRARDEHVKSRRWKKRRGESSNREKENIIVLTLYRRDPYIQDLIRPIFTNMQPHIVKPPQ